MTNIDIFETAYIEAAVWSSNMNDRTISPETLAQMHHDCNLFLTANIDDILAGPGISQAGHDFWLIRNGYSAGFRFYEWPEPQATRLSNAAQSLGEFELYIGDDGLVWGQQ